MKNNLADLNNILFEQLERLNDDSEDIDMEKEIKRSKAMEGVAAQIIEGGRLQLEAIKLSEEFGYEQRSMGDLLRKKTEKVVGIGYAK